MLGNFTFIQCLRKKVSCFESNSYLIIVYFKTYLFNLGKHAEEKYRNIYKVERDDLHLYTTNTKENNQEFDEPERH